ncbi:hypothetical protein C0J52_24871 [Blattella germanica]|nr:hypothetical protein C0J52_24871 [Blattella germanica]
MCSTICFASHYTTVSKQMLSVNIHITSMQFYSDELAKYDTYHFIEVLFCSIVTTSIMVIPKADEDPPHPYLQVFVLKPLGNSFYCQHDIFRLGIHDTA